MKQIRQVAVLIETSREYGRGLLRGVAQFHQEKPHWSVFFQQRDLGAALPVWLKSWQGDGILARVTDQKMAEQLIATGLPLIDLRGSARPFGVSEVGLCNQSVAKQAFEHLAACGLQHFAFVGEPSGLHHYDDERRDAFSRLVQDHGLVCHQFTNRTGQRTAKSWEKYQLQLAAWLTKLPKPVGVMCCHDDRGQQVLNACQWAELGVPDEVAVLGVDNDDLLCQLSIPPLSSVDVSPERIGYQAAATLDQVMDGELKKSGESILFEATGVVVRQSTDVIACDDPEIARALRYIRQNACNHLTVDDVEQHLCLSRSVLNLRFKKCIGHAPKREIQRVQMETAKRLLLSSPDSIQSIARQCGYNETWYFISVFRKQTGLTPGKYRKKQGKREEEEGL